LKERALDLVKDKVIKVVARSVAAEVLTYLNPAGGVVGTLGKLFKAAGWLVTNINTVKDLTIVARKLVQQVTNIKEGQSGSDQRCR